MPGVSDLGWWGDSHIKVSEMLVVSLRDVRDGKSLYLPIQVSLRALLKDIYKKRQDVCFSMVYFRCQFKQDGLLVLA